MITPFIADALRQLIHLWCAFSFSSILMYKLEAIELRLPPGIYSTISMGDGPQPHLNIGLWTRFSKAFTSPMTPCLCPASWEVQLSSGYLQPRWKRQCYIKSIIACPRVLDRIAKTRHNGNLRWNTQINLKESEKSSPSIQRWLSWVLVRSDIYSQRSCGTLLYTSSPAPKSSNLDQFP